MIVSVNRQSQFPAGSILSVRAGDVRRQAPVTALKDHTLKFPHKTDDIKIDVLQPLWRGQQVLTWDKNEQTYQISVSGPESEKVNCELTVTRAQEGMSDTPEQAVDKTEADKAHANETLKAKDYLEKHGLLSYFQKILESVVREKPDNPKMLVWGIIGQHLLDGRQLGIKPGSPDPIQDIKDTLNRNLQNSERKREELEKKCKRLSERLGPDSQEEVIKKMEEHEAKSVDLASQVKELQARLEKVMEQRQETSKHTIVPPTAPPAPLPMPTSGMQPVPPTAQPTFFDLSGMQWMQPVPPTGQVPLPPSSPPPMPSRGTQIPEAWHQKLIAAEAREKQLEGTVNTLMAKMQETDDFKRTLIEKFKTLEEAEKTRDDLRRKLEELQGLFDKMKNTSPQPPPQPPAAINRQHSQMTDGDMEETMNMLNRKIEELAKAETERQVLEERAKTMEEKLRQIQDQQKQSEAKLATKYDELKKAELETIKLEKQLDDLSDRVNTLEVSSSVSK